MNDHSVSVIIATYNNSEYLCECIDSVLEQTIPDIEVIIINDGSTDSTYEILEGYREKNSIRVIHQENRGQAYSINLGISMAKGRYIAFMDSDDKYPTSDCLERLYDAAEKNHAELCGGSIITNDNGIIKQHYMAGNGNDSGKKNCFVPYKEYFYLYGHTRFIYKTEMIKREGIRHGLYHRFGDQIMTLSSIVAAKGFYELDYPVYEYRINYKDDDYGEEVWLDVMRAFLEILEFMVKNDLRLMYERNAENLCRSFCVKTYRYYKNTSDTWNNLINRIQSVMEESGWSGNENTVSRYMQKCAEETEKLIGYLEDEKKTVFYGAGRNTETLIKMYPKWKDKMAGIVVSKNVATEDISGIEVCNIESLEYDKEITRLIITPGAKNKDEMFENALRLGFKDIDWVDALYVADMR